MTPAGYVGLARLDEPLARVLTNGLQQAISGVAPFVVIELNERLVNQSREQIEHLVLVDQLFGGGRLGSIEGEAAGEHGKPSQNGTFVFVEEVVTPCDRGLKGLLARHHAAAATSKKTEPVVEPGGDAVRVHQADAGCREL